MNKIKLEAIIVPGGGHNAGYCSSNEAERSHVGGKLLFWVSIFEVALIFRGRLVMVTVQRNSSYTKQLIGQWKHVNVSMYVTEKQYCLQHIIIGKDKYISFVTARYWA